MVRGIPQRALNLPEYREQALSPAIPEEYHHEVLEQATRSWTTVLGHGGIRLRIQGGRMESARIRGLCRRIGVLPRPAPSATDFGVLEC